MLRYQPPLRDMQFLMHEVFKVSDDFASDGAYKEIDIEIINAVLEQAAKFAVDVVQPLNMSGDSESCGFDARTHEVFTPQGFRAAYAQYIEGGWPSLSCDPAYGGQGLPVVINQCLYEMLHSANTSWAMYPGLSHGVYEALLAHGTPEQKKMYLPKLTTGEWTGTMCLTESHCGTDLGLLRCKAKPQSDGSYRLTGSKIFISAGEHDMAPNIVHLVLARLPGAPDGSKGISLFVVPKFIPKVDGTLGARNAIYCSGMEHKMGIHANVTAQIMLEQAQAWLVGKPHQGLAAMFVMMNAARLGVGTQSLGLTEIAYQNALIYAKQRIQMRSLAGVKAPHQPADPIIVHPDVRRMLLTAKAYAEGGRALGILCASLIDKEFQHFDLQVRASSAELVALLTPIMKAFLTDNGHIATNLCLQVFGGHGFIKEIGMEQLVRDNRITLIYEGTNTIQALDFLSRKVLANNGATFKQLAQRVASLATQEKNNPEMAEFLEPLLDLAEKLNKLTTEIGFKGFQNPEEIGAAAVDYLRIAGHFVFGYLWALMAQAALHEIAMGNVDPFYRAKLQTARFYFARLMPEVAGLVHSVRSGSRVLMETEAALA